MTPPANAVLLVGSPKPAGESVSEALGGHLARRLAAGGSRVTTMLVAPALRTGSHVAELLEAVDRADLLLLAFPLYVDSLPYLVTRALELIAAHRQTQASPRPSSLAAIVNCGFPEAAHSATALAICGQFASEAGYAWAGGLALGGGGAVSARALAEGAGMVRSVIASLDLAAAALVKGAPVPEEAISLMARPMMPAWLYTLGGNLGWLIQARRNHVLTRLGARPFKGAG